MSVAIFIKTESGDNYLNLFDGEESHVEICQQLNARTYGELKYLCEVGVVSNGVYDDRKLKADIISYANELYESEG